MTDVKKLRELAVAAFKYDSPFTISQFQAAANPQAIIEVLDRLERYREALRFYATAEYVDVKNRYGDPNDPDLEEDDGSIARKALEGGK